MDEIQRLNDVDAANLGQQVVDLFGLSHGPGEEQLYDTRWGRRNIRGIGRIAHNLVHDKFPLGAVQAHVDQTGMCYCEECGNSMIVLDNHVTHHVSGGRVNHDQDADHVARCRE